MLNSRKYIFFGIRQQLTGGEHNTWFKRRLLKLHKDELLPLNVYEAIRPIGSVISRMYGLSKMYKKDVPLRHILSMVSSSQHSLAKWLTSGFEPVLSLYLSHCVSDSFTFFGSLRNSILYTDLVFLIPSTSVPTLYITVTCLHLRFHEKSL